MTPIDSSNPGQNGAARLLSGNEAVAFAAHGLKIELGIGYPGTPSTEILETFSTLGGQAQWAANEKVALEVGIGAAYAGGAAIVVMKHVGLNVAADPLFAVAYTGVPGALVIVSADDPGMSSSQNEQDNRHYAAWAGLPMLEPADSQESWDFTLLAFDISRRWSTPVLLRMTTRTCHSKSVVRLPADLDGSDAPRALNYVRDVRRRVLLPAYARQAHRDLRARLARIQDWNEAHGPTLRIDGDPALGIIASGVAAMHAREAAPEASLMKIGMTFPLPLQAARAFAESVERCVVVEEGDPYMADSLRSAGVSVIAKPESFRFGELDVARTRRILAGEADDQSPRAPGKPPELCRGCPHGVVLGILKELNCIVAGDIGCYTLGALPPMEAMDTCLCMGASIGIGLGLRHVMPPEQAHRVVSVIGDSTFLHSGVTGLMQAIYNDPPTGHVIVILDNGTTAMTGMQEHPGTGRSLAHAPSGKVVIEDLVRALGVPNVFVVDPLTETERLRRTVADSLQANHLAVVIARRDCLLAARNIREYAHA